VSLHGYPIYTRHIDQEVEKIWKSFLLQNSYGNDVKQTIDEVKVRSADLRNFANICAQGVGEKNLSGCQEGQIIIGPKLNYGCHELCLERGRVQAGARSYP
jgi:hypothetical protein